MQDLEDRVLGVLLGLAAGDRNGGPIRMALRVAESLLDRGAFDLEDIGARYLDWWRGGAFDTGPTAAEVLSLVACGIPFEQAAIRVDEKAAGLTAGCNPAHRSAPLAMCSAILDSEVGGAAVMEAGLTHRHPLAGDVAAAVVCLCRVLIRGAPWSGAVELAAEARSPETRRSFEVHSLKTLSRTGYAPEALRAAVHFLDTSTSFTSALARSIHFAGPANYCPVLVGGIGGARWGGCEVQESPFHYEGELLPRLEAVALALARAW
jgi:ADP-ribosyl-[dinitrogen reductase] hydrolase